MSKEEEPDNIFEVIGEKEEPKNSKMEDIVFTFVIFMFVGFFLKAVLW
jgi:hypothetical protein